MRISMSKTTRIACGTDEFSRGTTLCNPCIPLFLSLSLSLLQKKKKSPKKSIKISIETKVFSNEYASETNSCKLGIGRGVPCVPVTRPSMSRNIDYDIYD